jgi:fumarate reductase subunit D
MRHSYKAVMIFLASLPQIVFAAPQTFSDLVFLIVYYVNRIIAVVIALAVLGLFIGIFRYGFSLGNEDHIKEAKRILFWGVVGLFVMVSIWGILRLLAQTFL